MAVAFPSRLGGRALPLRPASAAKGVVAHPPPRRNTDDSSATTSGRGHHQQSPALHRALPRSDVRIKQTDRPYIDGIEVLEFRRGVLDGLQHMWWTHVTAICWFWCATFSEGWSSQRRSIYFVSLVISLLSQLITSDSCAAFFSPSSSSISAAVAGRIVDAESGPHVLPADAWASLDDWGVSAGAGCLYLWNLGVDASQRNQGLATALIAALEAWAIERARARFVCLLVYKRNGPAMALYRKLGFAEVDGWIDPTWARAAEKDLAGVDRKLLMAKRIG